MNVASAPTPTRSARSRRVDSLDDERLRPFLPLIYIAWSDGDLSAEEVDGICQTVERQPGIDLDCKLAFRHWLNPEDPPTPQEYETLRRRLEGWLTQPGDGLPASALGQGTALVASTRPNDPITAGETKALDEIDEKYGPLGLLPEAAGATVRLREIADRSPTFDTAELTRLLDGRYAPIRRRMREILSQPTFTYREDLNRFQYRELILDWTRVLADEGLGHLAYPAPYGEDDPGSFIAAISMLGHHDLSLFTKFGVQFGLFGGAIARLGTADHHARYLSEIGALELPGSFAMTETGHGSNVRDLETVAVYIPETDEIEVTTPHDLARKDYIGNAAAHGRLAVVFARLLVDEIDHGVHAVLVPIRSADGSDLPGVRIEDNADKGGLNGIDNGRIWFDSVRVPRGALLDRFGSIDDDGEYQSDIPSPDRRFFTMIGTLVGGRVSVGSASVSVAKSALTIAVRYAHRRRQFGRSTGDEELLIDYPMHQQRLMPRLAATFAYHFAFENLIAEYGDGTDDHRGLEARAAGLKATASWHAIDTVQAAREATGGQGFLTANRLTAMRSDVDIFATYEGDNTVLTQLVAKAVVSDFQQQFESSSATGIARYLLRKTRRTITEAAPITLSTTDESDIRSDIWQVEQLAWRETHQVESLAERIRNRLGSGHDAFDAFTQVQTHAGAVATSHVDRLVLEAFASAVENVEDPDLRSALDRVRALHGLTTIQRNLAWFQEHSHMSAATAKVIRNEHEQLVKRVADDSLALVDAFGVPDNVIAAPIARRNRKGNDR